VTDFPNSVFEDTIVAISTPPGRGGIGIVRLSGSAARTIAEPLLKLRHPLAPAQARFAEVLDSTGETLDEAVVTWFEKPHSYTSEDVVEIAAHGSPVLLDHLLRECLSAGARLAEPGEFTQRAFISGRLDLTQAEAVHDLIEATTLHQARTAAQQLGGSLSRQISPIKQQLISLIAALEAGIDFAEDDIDTLPPNEIAAQIQPIQTSLAALERTFTYGRIVREGFTLAIIGRPNVGKSSLFNRLIERDRAIVTSTPGTTRDLVTERVSLEGIPVELIDTAGLREATDEAESIGIAKSREAMAEADVVLLVLDATAAVHQEDEAAIASLATRPFLLVLNKQDLAPSASLFKRDTYAVLETSEPASPSSAAPSSLSLPAKLQPQRRPYSQTFANSGRFRRHSQRSIEYSREQQPSPTKSFSSTSMKLSKPSTHSLAPLRAMTFSTLSSASSASASRSTLCRTSYLGRQFSFWLHESSCDSSKGWIFQDMQNGRIE
jgi:tRNA modification GTPase